MECGGPAECPIDQNNQPASPTLSLSPQQSKTNIVSLDSFHSPKPRSRDHGPPAEPGECKEVPIDLCDSPTPPRTLHAGSQGKQPYSLVRKSCDDEASDTENPPSQENALDKSSRPIKMSEK